MLPHVLVDDALGDAGEVVLSIFLLVFDDDNEGSMAIHKGMQVAWMVFF